MNISQQRQYLSLLPVLDALLTEVHVSKAADALSLSQSAVSHALNQLRSLFDDPILIRSQSGKMHLSPLAQSIAPAVKQQLYDAVGLHSELMDFKPEVCTDTFTIGASDYIADILITDLLASFMALAPKTQFKIKAIT